MIPQHFIDELSERADILEIVGSRIPLRRKGSDHWACCPFHEESTPSFHVVPDKGIYKCFGCGKGGNAIQFLMDYERMSFPEAVRQVASITGMEVPEDRPDDGGRREHFDQLRGVLERCASFYQQTLAGAQGESARNYLKQRGLDRETAERFGIGFVPDGWDHLGRALGTDEKARQLLIESGMLIEKDERRRYDRFRNRIMFPIRDGRGRTIAFGGRVIANDEPKYLNSPETPVFHKGRELYGLFEARRSRNLARLIIVEGYMDVIALAQQGIDGAIATLGTALTPDHLKIAWRICPELVFCFDGDKAGQAAARKSLSIVASQLQEGQQARFLRLPAGEDPDSIVRKAGKDAFLEKLRHAPAFSEYLLDDYAADADMDSVEGRAAYARTVREILDSIPSKLIREPVMELLAARARIRSEALASEQSAPAPEPAPPATPAPAPAPRAQLGKVRRRSAALQALQWLIWYPELAADQQPDADELDSRDADNRLLRHLLDWLREDPGLSAGTLFGRAASIDPEAQEVLGKLFAEEPPLDQEQARTEFNDAMIHLGRRNTSRQLRARLQSLREKQASEGLNDAERDEFNVLARRLRDSL